MAFGARVAHARNSCGGLSVEIEDPAWRVDVSAQVVVGIEEFGVGWVVRVGGRGRVL